MKAVRTKKPLTPLEAFHMLQENGGPISNCDLSQSGIVINAPLKGICPYSDYPFIGYDGFVYEHCALVTEQMPNVTPDGVPDLDGELAHCVYVGKGPLKEASNISKAWVLFASNNVWYPCGISRYRCFHYAIDPSYPKAREYLKKHYPELWEAVREDYEKEEPEPEAVKNAARYRLHDVLFRQVGIVDTETGLLLSQEEVAKLLNQLTAADKEGK